MNAEHYLATLKNAGFRLTEPRVAICRYLCESTGHPTAQQIYDELKGSFRTLSLTTVYLTLETLAHLGLITALGPAGDTAVHYEPSVEPHVNLACLTCHRILDLPSRHVRDVEREVAALSGHEILGGSVVYYTCCMAAEPASCRTRRAPDP